MSKPFLDTKICLSMIVKNESKVIQRCLESLKDIITSWVIVDTGSTDNTCEIIREVLKDIPGELKESPWVDFSTNRNESLNIALARKDADYIFFIDADDYLILEDTFKPNTLSEQSYHLTIHHSYLKYTRVCLVSTKHRWEWKGVLHEYIHAHDVVQAPILPNLHIQFGGDGNRTHNPNKYKEDAEVLERALLVEPDNQRYVFYLAQSYKDARLYQKAMDNYLKRAKMGGWQEEVYYSLLEVANMSLKLRLGKKYITQRYLEAYSYRLSRAESLVLLARYLYTHQDYEEAYLYMRQAVQIGSTADKLFVNNSCYGIKVCEEAALKAMVAMHHDYAIELLVGLLTNNEISTIDKERIQKHYNTAIAFNEIHTQMTNKYPHA
jgi:glycosyltransferase involved in cell wall biosynthesis